MCVLAQAALLRRPEVVSANNGDYDGVPEFARLVRTNGTLVTSLRQRWLHPLVRYGNGLPIMRPPAEYPKYLIPNLRVPRGTQKGLQNEREAPILLAVLLEGEGQV